jgi:hypothetical protein
LFAYELPNGLPAGSRTAWSRLSLLPLAQGALTPFSYSVLAEIAGRAWYQYFDALGFDPMPRARVVRQFQGHPYLNWTISATRDAEQAAIEPLTLRLNGQLFPLCKVEKPSFLAGLKASRNQAKVESLLKKLTGELAGVSQQLQAWQAKTQELRWTQAEVLQVMEEIEPVGVPSFITFFAARHNLDLTANRLWHLLPADLPSAARTRLLSEAIPTLYAPVINAEIRQAAEQTPNIPNVTVQPAALLAALEARQRKAAQPLLGKAQTLLELQGRALLAFSTILPGTRRWALAAAKEAMGDQRLLAQEDVFFYELEEMKEMMTGEWNISDRDEIQKSCARRKLEYAQWQQAQPSELLIGESETTVSDQ